MVKEEIGKEGTAPEEGSKDNDVNVPIHVVYEALPQELLPISSKDIPHKEYNQTGELNEEVNGKSLASRVVSIGGILFAIILLVLAIINTGYLDTYVTSLTQVSTFSGITLYDR